MPIFISPPNPLIHKAFLNKLIRPNNIYLVHNNQMLASTNRLQSLRLDLKVRAVFRKQIPPPFRLYTPFLIS